MWNNSMNLAKRVGNTACLLLAASSGFLSQQTRNTFILKRRWPPGLHKKCGQPKKLRARNFVYDLVEDTNLCKKPNLDLILTTYVEGLGNQGDRISMKPNLAYTSLLLPGLAVYASPEFCAKYAKFVDDVQTEKRFSSPFVERTMNVLSTRTLCVNMSDTNSWVLEKWHVNCAFRLAGFCMPEDSITLPKKQISGPDTSIEGKEFFVTVTINKKEQVKVRCRIYHVNARTSMPQMQKDFYKTPAEPIFPEDKPILDALPTYFENTKPVNL